MSDNEHQCVDSSFKELLKEYIDLTKTINASMADIKLVKDRRTKIEEAIHIYMSSNQLDKINTPEMSFQVYKSKVAKPLNKGFIKSKLSELVGEIKADELTSYLFDNREYNEKETIKKTSKKPLKNS